MLAILNYNGGSNQPVVARTAVGSISRSFNLPIQLSGLTMTINGVACGLKSVSRHQIIFVVPPFISSAVEGTIYPIVINNQGTILRGDVTIVPARPDIFNDTGTAGGRAQVLNVTNRVHLTEPFNVYTVRIRGGVRTKSVLRVKVTGIANTSASSITLRLGSVTVNGTFVQTGGILVEPGVYTVDFTLPDTAIGLGDVPLVITVTAGTTTFTSRLDDTAPRLIIL